jgi:hypothetical protein
MREAVRVALEGIATRFSQDAPSSSFSRDEPVLRRRYSAMDAWPADAEFGLFILSWTMGPGFTLGDFRAKVNALVPDFHGASARLRRAGGSAPPAAFITLTLVGIARTAFSNAAIVLRWNLTSDILYWPTDLSRSAGATL